MTELARVKLFCLDNFGRWEDKGIGQASRHQNTIQVNSEDSSEPLLHFYIEKITAFRQSETIIQWTDRNSNNYALSFQQSESADVFWNIFQEYLSKESLNECFLPPPLLENVEEIVKVLSTEDGRRNISITWVSELCKNVFESENFELFFPVFKELINLGKFEVFEAILTDKNFVAIFKALDKDPERSFTSRFGEFFETTAKFVNILSISDEGTVRKINFAYRILCLKENLMSRSFKEYTIQCLSNFHLVIWNQILLDLANMAEVRTELLLALRNCDLNAFLMVSESFQNSRFVSANTRLLYYTTLKNEGILSMIQKAWQTSNPAVNQIRRIVIDVFLTISYISPGLLIESFLEAPDKIFIKIFKTAVECEAEVIQKTAELVKALFNPDSLSAFPSFFRDFYEKIFPFYLNKLNNRFVRADSLDISIEILQLLSEILEKDPLSMQVFISSRAVIPLLSGLIQKSSKGIKIASIKVIKSLSLSEDSSIQKKLINSQVFSKIFKVFEENMRCEGMVFSAILSLCKEINLCPFRSHVLEVLNSFDLPVVQEIFRLQQPLPQLDIRRSRGFSFDLTASEVFVDSDRNSPTLDGEMEEKLCKKSNETANSQG